MAKKLGTGARGAGKAGNGRPLTIEDNLTPAERKKAKEDAEAMQLMSVVAQVKAADVQVAATKIPYDAAKEARKDVIRTAQKAGFKAYEIEDIIKDSKAGERKSVADAEARRYRFRKVMGLPVGMSESERDLEARLPDVEADGQHWRAAGYTDGVTGVPSDPPKACIEAGHGNRYDEGYKDGQTILALQLSQPKGKPAPEAEVSELDRKRAEKAEEKRLKEALAKKQDPATCTVCGGPEGDGPPDDAIICPGCDAEWLPPETEATGGLAAGVIAEPGTNGVEEFEATPEELAAQAGRPSTTEETDPVEVV